MSSAVVYRVIRSNRRSLSLQFNGKEFIVRAPYCVTTGQIERFVKGHSEWMEIQLAKSRALQEKKSAVKQMTEAQFAQLKKLAKIKIPERIAYYAAIAGLSQSVGKVCIRCQKTRWGSCSANGNISMNCLLLLAPQEVLDSVVVHELCHLKHMDHSNQFYADVLRLYPEYRKWNKWLKDNGPVLYAMLPDSLRK